VQSSLKSILFVIAFFSSGLIDCKSSEPYSSLVRYSFASIVFEGGGLISALWLILAEEKDWWKECNQYKSFKLSASLCNERIGTKVEERKEDETPDDARQQTQAQQKEGK